MNACKYFLHQGQMGELEYEIEEEYDTSAGQLDAEEMMRAFSSMFKSSYVPK